MIRIKSIQNAVASEWGVDVADIISRRQSKLISKPRHAAMYLARILTAHSLPEIGRAFGGRDHTTVMHAIKRVEERKQFDMEFRDKLAAVLTRLNEAPDISDEDALARFIEETLSDLRVRLHAEAERDPVALLRRLMGY